ncbi:MAG TPA: hypothetical protein VG147_13430 [Solirubrobacteraceae bacterium]|nr:hypothetical protein [Solirubrobacteraceae bacterium]
MTGFDILDRYDVAASLLISVVIAGALALGAPLWVAGLIIIVCWTGMFIHHFDEIMRE